MAAPSKDTIYIDIDDEITSIIDKLKASDSKVVALVLPKRASTLQSIVNMKLLKRAADDTKKNVVLITSEAGLLPLAGVVGLHVAKTLSSKPEIPSAPATNDDEETVDEEAGLIGSDEIDEPEIDKNKPVGALAGAAAIGVGAAALAADGVETVELDDDELPADTAKAAKTTGAAAAAKKPKKDKSLKVPDFDRFRLWLIFGGLALVVLIVGFVFAFKVLPKATIYITTDASNVSVNEDITLSTTATSLDESKNIVPAKKASQDKTYTQQADATGKKNNGDKATGSVSMSACIKSFNSPDSVPAGTGISVNGQTYITQQTTKFSNSGTPNGTCISYSATGNTPITAQSGGANYNVNNASFAVANRSDVVATGSASGGTDNNVTVVSQADIDNAKSKISTNESAVKQTLEDNLTKQNLYPITATFSSGTPVVTTSANVGDAASSVTVTEKVTYTMFGVKQDDLTTIVNNNVKKQIDTSKQSILSDGLDSATFTVGSATDTGADLTMETTATVGPDLDVDTIKQEAAGQKSSDVQQSIESNPDVKDVKVTYSPFWVSSVPSNTKKINVIIAKPTNTTSKSDASNP